MLIVTLVLFSLQRVVAASSGYTFQPPSEWETGSFAVWIIFDFVYLALLAYAILAVLRLPDHRLPYVILVSSLLCAIIQCTMNFAYILAAYPGDSPSLTTLSGLNITATFFGDWAPPMFFFTMALVLQDRDTAIRIALDKPKGNMQKVLPVVHYSFHLVLMLVATVAASLLAAYNGHVLSSRPYFDGPRGPALGASTSQGLQAYHTANYVYIALLFLTAIYVIALAIILCKSLKRSSAFDRMTKLILYAIAPSYFISLIGKIASSIVSTDIFATVSIISGLPSGTSYTPILVTNPDIISGIFPNFFFALGAGLLIVAGLRPYIWSIQHNSIKLDGHHRYLESPSQSPANPAQSTRSQVIPNQSQASSTLSQAESQLDTWIGSGTSTSKV